MKSRSRERGDSWTLGALASLARADDGRRTGIPESGGSSERDLSRHLFERVSVAGQLHAAGVLLRRAIGKATVEEAERFSRTDPLFVRTMGGYLTTAEVLAEEAQLLERVESGRAKFEPLGGSEEWPISDPKVLASEEQTLAIEHVLRTRDF
jgi:hypothetical protein